MMRRWVFLWLLLLLRFSLQVGTNCSGEKFIWLNERICCMHDSGRIGLVYSRQEGISATDVFDKVFSNISLPAHTLFSPDTNYLMGDAYRGRVPFAESTDFVDVRVGRLDGPHDAYFLDVLSVDPSIRFSAPVFHDRLDDLVRGLTQHFGSRKDRQLRAEATSLVILRRRLGLSE